MKKCKNCKHFEPWINLKDGICETILHHLGFNLNKIEAIAYVSVREDFFCAAFKAKRERVICPLCNDRILKRGKCYNPYCKKEGE